jgi:hypothetical protein
MTDTQIDLLDGLVAKQLTFSQKLGGFLLWKTFFEMLKIIPKAKNHQFDQCIT